MSRLNIVFFLILLFANIDTGLAQPKTMANPWSFQSMVNVGLLEGETGSAFQLQTINGARYKSWFAGVGLGLDYYRIRTIPLFIDLRKEFGEKRDKLFIYADGGINFNWATDVQKSGYLPNEQFHNGFYSDLGLGYKTLVGNKSALIISLGYSYKKTSESYTTYNYYQNYYPINLDQNSSGEQINYNLNRLSMKIGWVF